MRKKWRSGKEEEEPDWSGGMLIVKYATSLVYINIFLVKIQNSRSKFF